ncbi:glutathione peroxidase [Furfurilactobacillus curtus]|uniref:Glutathione peroxidase n=1 Tax=Furfurilactobacillus curtus TaxID=1746200 RepID=A0ABQ5JRP8_9LACO
MTTIYDFKETELSGQPLKLSAYRGNVVLIVNTASKCGLAPQLKGLEKLYQNYQDQGLVVLGLPSNQFHQELANDSDINDFCQVHYGVTFPMTQKIQVNGEQTDPLFVYLKQASGHGRIKWNYTKFLIGRDGHLIKRFAPTTTPENIEDSIINALETNK